MNTKICELMQDKNGRTMRTGDIVKIEGAFFKNDNGYYFIEHAPGDVSWCGSDYCLKKIGKRGKISTAKYNIAFFPLSSYCSDQRKNAESDEHNKQFATIEVVFDVDRSDVISYFEEEAEKQEKQAEVWKWRFGEESETYLKEKAIAEFHAVTAERMKKEDTAEATQSEETFKSEEMTTEEEKTAENGTGEATQAQEQPTEETADTITAEPESDMFAELAKAFITGKQAPKKPHKATETAKTEETPTVEETQPKSDYNPPEPQSEKSGTGYTGEPSEVFTVSQLADLLNGKSVILGDDYDRRAYIAPTPYNSARLVYSYRLGRQSAEILPGMSPEYCGFIANGKYYSTAKNAEIAAELAEDVNIYIKNRIQTEEQAEEHAAEVCEAYEMEKVKNAHQYAQTDSARRHFYEDTAPTLKLYTRSRDTKATDIVSYLTHPTETVKRIASEYIQYNAADIATAYIIYNKTAEALNEITSDPEHAAHAIKRMTKAMSAEFKTVKVTIANGETVTAEARGINALRHSGYMSSYYVAFADRQKLPQDGHRAKDIQPQDIKQITHGGRILYKAS